MIGSPAGSVSGMNRSSIVGSPAMSTSFETSFLSTSPYEDAEEESDGEKELSRQLTEYLASMNLAAGENANFDSRMQELDASLEFCKTRLRTLSTDDTEEPNQTESKDLRRRLLDRIVALGLLKQQHIEDSEQSGAAVSNPSDVVIRVRRHEFVAQSVRGRNPYCEVCLGSIWRLIQRWRRCRCCGFRAHEKCISTVRRACAAAAVAKTDFSLKLEICEERGLDAQGYACAECATPLEFGGGPPYSEPRLCDYSGLYFCEKCHWNDARLIPARAVRNMDCQPRPVSRAAKQLLAVIDSRPLLPLDQLNPALFGNFSNLARIARHRRNILYMKCYFLSCANARKQKLLLQLDGPRQHFVDGAELYSALDLRDAASGRLLAELEQLCGTFERHITRDCATCRGHGHFCELCPDDVTPERKNELLFPFQPNVAVCHQCLAVFHTSCWQEKGERPENCTRCLRRQRRGAVVKMDGDGGGEEAETAEEAEEEAVEGKDGENGRA